MQQAFRTVEQASIRAEKARTQTEKDGARQRERLATQEARAKEKQLAATAREIQKQEKLAVRETEKAERAKIIEIEKSAKYMARVRETSATMAGRFARQQADAEIRELKRTSDARARFARTVGGSVAGHANRMMSSGVSMAGMALSLGGGFGIADSVGSEMRYRGMAADIANSGNMPGKTKRSSADVVNGTRSTAVQYGLNEENVLGGLQEFVGKTGELDKGLAIMKQLGELARATGSDFKDLASAAGDIFNSDTKQNADQLMATMRILAGEGKKGAIEVRDLAQYGGRITAAAGMFSGPTNKNVAELGAIAQLARAKGGAVDAAEATESVARLGSDLAKHADKFKKAGINVKDGKVLRDPTEVLLDSVRATKGDVTKLSSLYGERSVKSVLGVAQTYRDAGGGDAGMAAARKAIEEISGAALTAADAKKASDERMAEADAQLAQNMEQLQAVVGSQLLPVLTQAIPKFAQLIPVISHWIDFLLKNPLEGAGLIVGAKIGTAIAGDLASAGIGALVKKAIALAMGGESGTALTTALLGSGGAAGGGGAAAALGSAGAGAAGLGVILGGAAYGTYTQNDPAQNAADAAAMKASNPAEYARRAAALAQQNQHLDPKSREYAANLAFIHGGGKSDPSLGLSQQQKDAVAGGVKNIEALQYGRAKGAVDITTLVNFDPFQQQMDMAAKKLAGGAASGAPTNTKGNPADPSRSVSMAHPARGGAQ